MWAEVTYTGNTQPVNLQERLAEMVRDSAVEVLSIKDESPRKSSNTPPSRITIKDMKPIEMLNLYFEEYKIPQEERDIYMPLYMDILREMELDAE